MVQVFEHADLLGKCGQGAGLRRHSREANLGFVLEKEKNKDAVFDTLGGPGSQIWA
jgi:hypothetical protein